MLIVVISFFSDHVSSDALGVDRREGPLRAVLAIDMQVSGDLWYGLAGSFRLLLWSCAESVIDSWCCSRFYSCYIYRLSAAVHHWRFLFANFVNNGHQAQSIYGSFKRGGYLFVVDCVIVVGNYWRVQSIFHEAWRRALAILPSAEEHHKWKGQHWQNPKRLFH